MNYSFEMLRSDQMERLTDQVKWSTDRDVRLQWLQGLGKLRLCSNHPSRDTSRQSVSIHNRARYSPLAFPCT